MELAPSSSALALKAPVEVDSIRDTSGSNDDGFGDEVVFQLLGEKKELPRNGGVLILILLPTTML